MRDSWPVAIVRPPYYFSGRAEILDSDLSELVCSLTQVPG